MTQSEPSFSCRTDGLTPDSKILWYTEEMVEAAQVLRLNVDWLTNELEKERVQTFLNLRVHQELQWTPFILF